MEKAESFRSARREIRNERRGERKYERKERRERVVRLASRWKSGFFSLLFSRFGVVVIILIMQILMMMTVWSFLKDLVADYLVIIRTTFEILVIIALINRPMESAAKMSWILLITLIPLAGTLFYVWTSIEMGYGTIRNKLTWINKDSSKYVMKTDSAYKKLDSIDKDSAALSRYLTKYDSTAVFENSKTEYFPLGQDKFLCMLEELEKA